MLNTLGDIRNDFLVKMGTTTTIGNYTDAMIGTWVSQAHSWAAGFQKWPFTERKDNSQTWSSATEDYAYPSDFRSDSIRLLQVGGYWLQKLNFQQYQIYRQDNPANNSPSGRVFSDFGRRYFVNPYIDVSGTITAWGQYLPSVLDNSDPTVTTVFSGGEDEGNSAIVEEVISYAKQRENKPKEAQLHHQNAITLLNTLWGSIAKEQFGYQSKNNGMWKRFDVLGGGYRENNNSINQF